MLLPDYRRPVIGAERPLPIPSSTYLGGHVDWNPSVTLPPARSPKDGKTSDLFSRKTLFEAILIFAQRVVTYVWFRSVVAVGLPQGASFFVNALECETDIFKAIIQKIQVILTYKGPYKRRKTKRNNKI